MTGVGLVCPRCRGMLAADEQLLRCGQCDRRFPTVAGIPDLRVSFADPYVSREEDVARAHALEARFDALDFAGLLGEHWRLEGRPNELAERFLAADLAARQRSDAYLAEIERERGAPIAAEDSLLEVGCGTGALAASAARRVGRVVASDISLRWLVLAKKRLRESHVTGVQLVCCAAKELPFKAETFDVVAASDVIEHVADQRGFVADSRRVLRPGGMLFLATPNRFSLGLEPHVRLWGVGLLPRRLARRYVLARRRTPYEHVRLLSAGELRRLLRAGGFEPRIVPPAIPPSTQSLYGGVELRLVRAYNRARSLAPARRLLLAVGPFFHVFATKGRN